MPSTKTHDGNTQRLLSYMQPRTDSRSADQIDASLGAADALAKTRHPGRRATGSDPQTASALKYMYQVQDAKGSTDAE